MTLNINFFFTSPLQVVRVTEKNLDEVAQWCGGKVAKVESRKQKGRVDSYVWVPTPEGSKISWAFPGMYVSRRLAINEMNELKPTYSVFRKDYFRKNYFEDPTLALEATWGRDEKERREADRKARTVTIELPEGVDVAAAKAKIIEDYVAPEEFIADQDMVAIENETMVDQRNEARAELVEAEEEFLEVPRTIGDALNPFEAGDPSRA